MEPIIIDFETEAIEGNPTVRPPRPVGIAIKNPGKKSRYFAWGHPEQNNCAGPEPAKTIVDAAIRDGRPVLMHNAKFDLSVMREWWPDVAYPAPMQVEDTMFLIALQDPYAPTFSLKPSSERILGIPPSEQDTLREWVTAHIACPPKEWGAHISKAPGELVGSYARGDVDRTWKLWQHLRGKTPTAPYDRERRLLPILIRSEQKGIRCDQEHIEADLAAYEQALAHASNKIHKLLRNPEVNLDSGDELANALEVAGLVTEWIKTPTGRRSTARANLEQCIKHPAMLALLQYRNALAHCLSNFMRPWSQLAGVYKGRLHPEWNQVRQSRGETDHSKGTRTGRVSCTKPNFTNVPNEYSVKIPKGLPPLPIMRQYLVPDKGYTWLKRDYSQQELRILAHYSEGRLFQRYVEDPKIDAHAETGNLIHTHAGLALSRKHVKITGFSIIYGSGTYHLSVGLGVNTDEARAIRDAYFKALPEVKQLMDACQATGRRGEVITTWGGRQYYVEPPKDGRDFGYKLLNYLIQGSAADQTKEAIIRWDANPGKGQFLAQVYDEINIQAPAKTAVKDMALLRKAMESIEFDVKMLSDGMHGQSWANLTPCD